MPDVVTSRTDGAICYVTLNRPEKRNAIDREVLASLVDRLGAAERDQAVRAIVLSGEGAVFSAGVDCPARRSPVQRRLLRLLVA